jgi:hypothetical protein
MTNKLRHRCRYCRSNLPGPVDNEHYAFCKRGCFSSFYLKRCRVCEEPIHLAQHRRGPKRILCRKNDCRLEYRRRPDLYNWSARISPEEPKLRENTVPGRAKGYHPTASGKISSEVPVKWAFKSGTKRGGWRWEVSYKRWQVRRDDWEEHREHYQEREGDWVAREDEYRLLDRDGKLVAGFVPDQTGYRIFHPRTGRLQRAEDAKRLAISLALANLPLEPGLAERLANINEVPPDPPQHLLPWTATYLAGLAAATIAVEPAPPIAPDDMGIAADADLEMPSLLERRDRAASPASIALSIGSRATRR